MPDIFVGEEKKKEDIPKEETPPEKKVSQAKIKESRSQILEFQEHRGHNHNHFFTSYCEAPEGVSFADKLKEEVLLLFLRKHFVTNIPWIISAVAMSFVPFILVGLNSFGILPLDSLPSTYILMILILYYFFIFGFIFTHYLTWFYNIGLVTNQRIIDIDFSSLVFENVDATKLSQVEDVGYKQVGIIRSIFDYGDVHIHTAGPATNFEFLAVPHPEKVINVINDLIGEIRHA